MCCRASHRTSTSISGAFIQLTICRVLSSPYPARPATPLRCVHASVAMTYPQRLQRGLWQWRTQRHHPVDKRLFTYRVEAMPERQPRAGENPGVDWSCACVKSSHEKRCSKRCACQSVRQPDSPNPSMLNTCLELSHVNRAKNCSIHSGEA